MIDALFTFALLASGITANKLVLCTIPATFFVALRMLSAGFMLTLYHVVRPVRWNSTIVRKDLGILGGIALATTFVPSLLKAFALRNLISSKAALIGSLDPFATALYAYFFFHEKLSLRQWSGICLGFLGIVVITPLTSCPDLSFFTISLPEIAALLAVFISRAGWMWAQMLLKKERYSPSELNGILMIIGGVYALIAAYWVGEISYLSLNWYTFAALVYTIVVGNIIAYSLYGNLLKHHSITYVSLASLLVPLCVHLYGPLVLNEPLSSLFFIGFFFIAGGIYIFSRT